MKVRMREPQEGGSVVLYPETTADNVITNNGESVQEYIDRDEPEIRFGDGYEETDNKPTIIFRDRMFILTYSGTLSSLVSNKYLRSTILLPINNIESYNVNFTLTGASGSSIENTTHLYVREKHADRFQLSTVGNYTTGDTVNVDVQVIGVIAK